MNFIGAFHGLFVFVLIGLFHIIVIKAEYYLGRKSNILFGVFGILALVLSLLSKNITVSTLCSTFAFCCFWSIKEIFEQEKRVLEGRFPRNPNRIYPYDHINIED